MYTYQRKNLPKQTIELIVTSPWADIEEQYNTSFEALRKELAVEGFRKGKAPKEVAEKNLRKEAIYDHLLRAYIPKVYSEIVQKEDMKPVVPPRIELESAKENEEWKVKLTTAESPKVNVGKYQEKVKEAKNKVKSSDIWVPGKDKELTEADKEKQKNAEFQAALQAIMDETTIEISDLIIDEDVERRLSRLVDDVQKVGLTMDGYLKSKNLTREQITEQIKKEIEENYKIEFALQAIADKEDLKVEQAEIDKMFEGIKDDKEKAAAMQNAYYYAALLRKQKTLDFITSL